MSEHLLIGILALFIAVILCVIGRPNVRGQSSLFFPSTPKPFLPIILIFATVALTELILIGSRPVNWLAQLPLILTSFRM